MDSISLIRRRFADDIEELLGKITVVEDEKIPGGMNWPETWATVTVRLKGGRTLYARCDKPKGRGDQPLSQEEHLAKFLDCAQRVLSPERIDRVLGLIERLDHLEDASELCSALSVESVPA